MHTRTTRWTAGLLLAGILTTLLAFPGAPRAVAAASCTAWTSESQPPSTIRVFRTATGAVDTVDFRTYVKNVLSREWISSWTTESLRAGALAVKNYAWYQVLHYRGYVTSTGMCFDIFDSTRDQHYDPSRPTYTSMAAAVDATWGTLALKAGRIFPTYYNAGVPGEACGANANGWRMYQWGSQSCGLAGRSAAQIMAAYYTGVSVTAAPPPVTPPATPVPTPVPTPRPTPVPTPVPTATPTPAPTGAPTAVPTTVPTPVATPIPTPHPTPIPTAIPAPIPAGQPGGGQSGIVGAPAPPPPPLADPEPIVVIAAPEGAVAVVAEPSETAPHSRAWERDGVAGTRVLEWDDRWHTGSAQERSRSSAPAVRADPRLVTFRLLLAELGERLVRAIAAELRCDPVLALLPLPR